MTTSNLYRKDHDRISLREIIPPGYKVAHMIASLNGQDKYRITFAISPTSLNENRSNNFQVSKTNTGWFLQRMGPNLMQVSIDGYMLDIEGYLEKHKFLENWKSFLEDKRVSSSEYENHYTIRLICMGRAYYGVVTDINIGTSAVKPYLHQYRMGLTVFKDQYIYKPEISKITLKPAVTSSVATVNSSNKNVGQLIYNIMG